MIDYSLQGLEQKICKTQRNELEKRYKPRVLSAKEPRLDLTAEGGMFLRVYEQSSQDTEKEVEICRFHRGICAKERLMGLSC